ncbi:unnamed protein product [Ectocarpus sp. 12 AP-2014]
MNIDLPDGNIHFVVRGTGVPILILHGGGLDHRHMLGALEPIFDGTSGWKRVYIDLPGHGLSRVNENVATQEDVFHMIAGFADAVFADDRFAIIGESRGSYHAMAFAHCRPNDLLGMMLVVADGMPEATVDWRPSHQTLETVEIASATSPEAKARFDRLVVQSHDILTKIERTKIPASQLVDDRLAKSVAQNFSFGFDLTNPSKLFEKPCLILNGRQDAIAGYSDMMNGIERYPRATLAILDKAGHSLSWEQPSLFKAHTLEWLGRMKSEI